MKKQTTKSPLEASSENVSKPFSDTGSSGNHQVDQTSAAETAVTRVKLQNVEDTVSFSIGPDISAVVDARFLHDFLDSKMEFSEWLNVGVVECELLEDIDYGVFCKTVENGGGPTDGYWLTLETAKDMALLERSDLGREAREHFTDCLGLIMAATTPPPPEQPIDLSDRVAFAAAMHRDDWFETIEKYRR